MMMKTIRISFETELPDDADMPSFRSDITSRLLYEARDMGLIFERIDVRQSVPQRVTEWAKPHIEGAVRGLAQMPTDKEWWEE